MIEYKFKLEKEILLHYARTLNHNNIEAILTKGQIESSEEAQELAHFFWVMVDQTVIDTESGVVIVGHTNQESWCEYIMQSLRSHFIATGYMKIWKEESDKV